jgi:hypothetical protein
MIKRTFFVVAAVSALSCGGPGGMDAGTDPETTCDAMPTATSFAKVYSDVFPACTACHKMGLMDGSGSYGLYDTQANALMQVNKVSAYAGMAKTLKVVDPKHLENSTMWLKVLGRAKSPGGNNLQGLMPLGGPPLSADKQKILKDWICSGAAM